MKKKNAKHSRNINNFQFSLYLFIYKYMNIQWNKWKKKYHLTTRTLTTVIHTRHTTLTHTPFTINL